MLWAGIETRSGRLRTSSCLIFALAFLKLLIWDTPYGYRPAFIPIFNRYFLSALVVIGCLFGAAALYQTLAKRKKVSGQNLKFVFLLSAVVALWLVSSIETVTFFQGRAAAQRLAEDARHQRWLGQMALSVVWAVYAAVLAAIGFLRRSSVTRWAALALFALTIVKAMFVDIAELQQLYRIIVFFVLGILLLLVAWGYHKAFHARESTS
jgi:Predicted membrane protein